MLYYQLRYQALKDEIMRFELVCIVVLRQIAKRSQSAESFVRSTGNKFMLIITLYPDENSFESYGVARQDIFLRKELLHLKRILRDKPQSNLFFDI